MGGLTTPEGNTGALEAPLTLQVTKEAKIMISKLKELKLDEVSAPGMAVFGDENRPIAILFGKVKDPAESQNAQEKHLVVSHKGFFLAEGKSDVDRREEALSSTLSSIRNNVQETAPNVSLDELGRLKIDTNGNHQAFNLKKLDSTPEQFTQILKTAIENSRQIAQKPLFDEIARAKAGNVALDNMIAQEKSQLPPNPPSAQQAA